MKLRCTHNSIRLRLRKSDIHSLEQHALVSESIYLGSEISFSFSLSLKEELKEISVTHTDTSLEIQLPKARGLQWITTNQVGIEVMKDFGDGNTLHVLIEKDFPCLDRENENKSDTFWELSSQEKPEKC